MKFSKRPILALSVVTFVGLAACAKQMAPPGGPADTTPPQIDSTQPASGSTGVAANAPLTITFSEPMQRDEVEGALSIFPAPSNPPELDWKGSRLVITPDTAWSPEQTYIVTLQTNARDRHGNILPQSLQFAFSTGAHIDSAAIVGTIGSGDRPRQGAMALCYRIDSVPPNPELDTADYVVQTDSAGHFRFGFLSPGTYRIYGLDDRDRDWLWYIGSEPIAVPSEDIELTSGVDTVSLPPIELTSFDTVIPGVSDCSALNPAWVRIDFNTTYDSTHIQNFYVQASDSAQTQTAVALYALESSAAALFAHFDPPLQAPAYNLAVAVPRRGDLPQRIDSCTLQIPDVWDTAFHPGRFVLPDTSLPLIAATDSVLILMRLPIDHLTDDTLQWSGEEDLHAGALPQLTNPFTISVPVPQSLQLRGPLELAIPGGFAQDAAGRSWPQDTLLTLRFRFPWRDSCGDYQLALVPPPANPAAYRLGLRPQGSASQPYWLPLDSAAAATGFLAPGAYSIQLHHDRNGDRRWNPGWPYPIEFSEPIWNFSDSLAVRARFTTELTLHMPDRK